MMTKTIKKLIEIQKDLPQMPQSVLDQVAQIKNTTRQIQWNELINSLETSIHHLNLAHLQYLGVIENSPAYKLISFLQKNPTYATNFFNAIQSAELENETISTFQEQDFEKVIETVNKNDFSPSAREEIEQITTTPQCTDYYALSKELRDWLKVVIDLVSLSIKFFEKFS